MHTATYGEVVVCVWGGGAGGLVRDKAREPSYERQDDGCITPDALVKAQSAKHKRGKAGGMNHDVCINISLYIAGHRDKESMKPRKGGEAMETHG